MDNKIQNELNKIRDIIINTVPVEQIYLFGSYAYGTPNEDSDLDIYVVLKDDVAIRELEIMDMIGVALYKKKSIAVDILVLKKSRFLYRVSGLTLEREIFTKGIKIYG
ncbi:MAG: nucleotidyltransferase domain-containing protein [Planctomycetaceae bacterium]|jgi:predicted nucleotidyltransferase|nr:nucleotidyltransferase domain-containing protein [Planctomycetaceae bacterium]